MSLSGWILFETPGMSYHSQQGPRGTNTTRSDRKALQELLDLYSRLASNSRFHQLGTAQQSTDEQELGSKR